MCQGSWCSQCCTYSAPSPAIPLAASEPTHCPEQSWEPPAKTRPTRIAASSSLWGGNMQTLVFIMRKSCEWKKNQSLSKTPLIQIWCANVYMSCDAIERGTWALYSHYSKGGHVASISHYNTGSYWVSHNVFPSHKINALTLIDWSKVRWNQIQWIHEFALNLNCRLWYILYFMQ